MIHCITSQRTAIGPLVSVNFIIEPSNACFDGLGVRPCDGAKCVSSKALEMREPKVSLGE